MMVRTGNNGLPPMPTPTHRSSRALPTPLRRYATVSSFSTVCFSVFIRTRCFHSLNLSDAPPFASQGQESNVKEFG
jgi:hypothetical protein